MSLNDRLQQYTVSKVGLFKRHAWRAFWFLKGDYFVNEVNGWGYHLPRRFQL